MPDSYFKKKELFPCFNTSSFAEGRNVTWKTTEGTTGLLRRPMSGARGPGQVCVVGGTESSEGHGCLHLHNSIPVDLFGLIPFFSEGAIIESRPVWLRVGLSKETSEAQGCVSSMQTIKIPGDFS